MTEKVWIITGCSSGLGRALAEAALERGDKVCATARSTVSLHEWAARWPARVHLAELDVTDPGQRQAVVAETLAAFNRIDVLVNNAGYGLLGAVEETDPEASRHNFEVNFFAPLELIRLVLPHFRAAGGGHILNISAAAAIGNYAGFGVYGASKCALEGLSEALAAEMRAFGGKVTMVQPGPFRTEFIARSLRRVTTPDSAYAASVGKFGAFLEAIEGKQPGDPVLAARALLAAVDAERPPARLVLGKYALEKARRLLRQRETELAAWEKESLAADGPAA